MGSSGRPKARRGSVRKSLALTGVFSLLFSYGLLLLAGPASAQPFSGGISPTIFSLNADLNGDDAATGRDDSNEFYGSTHIIDGKLDCDTWAGANAGTAGSGTITTADDCTLVGYDGTADGVTINVVDGTFATSDPDGAGGSPAVAIADGTALPTVFNAADPDNPDVGDSDFAWSTIDGRVDSNGNESIDADDCHFGLIGQTTDTGLGDPTDGADVLGNDGTNQCGFASAPATADNGLVDLNSDSNITSADTCSDGCFFGHDVLEGVVQEVPAAPPPLPPAGQPFSGGVSPTIFGSKADLNGDDAVTGRDDSNEFYSSTHIIDGKLDCDTWGTTANAGTAGSGTITTADDCTLIGYDGTADGVEITVVNGSFATADGVAIADGTALPTVFNAADPDNPDVGDSDFAWSTIDGRVDSNGNESIDADDCHFGLIGQTTDTGLGDPTDGADVLGNDGTNQCGFASAPATADNGLVDLNSDSNITSADTCSDGCFFGHDVLEGVVQGAPPPQGYWILESNGGVHARGAAGFFGSASGVVASGATDVDSTSTGGGYWIVENNGGVHARGDAGFFGSANGVTPSGAKAISGAPGNCGYWIAEANGGVHARGCAGFFGSVFGVAASPVVGIVSTPSGNGYWIFEANGGVHARGDAGFFGSASGVVPSGASRGDNTSNGGGYWIVENNGGVHARGNAGFFGSAHPFTPSGAKGISGTSNDQGYWITEANGGVHARGNAGFFGSVFGIAASPVVDIEGTGS